MRASPVRQTMRIWLPLAIASVVAATLAVMLPRFYPMRRPDDEAWRWNDEMRLTLCLSKVGARQKNADFLADLAIEGTLVGFGDMADTSDPRDSGNQVGCYDYPQRYIDVRDGEGETWRIMYALPGEQTPAVHARVGSPVRFRFYSTFHSGQTARFVLRDQGGPVVAIEMYGYSPRGFEEGDVAVGWGRMFGHRPTGCGGDEVARALRVSGDTDVSVPPGQVRSFVSHGARYRFWNIQSVNVLSEPCVDGYDSTSWVLWRE